MVRDSRLYAIPVVFLGKAVNDITLIFYTSNRIPEFFALNVMKHIQSFGIPIISVSQKPIAFGKNICVGEIGCSVYNVYKQILIGVKEAKTKYVACCEDDTLYVKEHFEFEPPDGGIFYNVNRWRINLHGMFYYRNRRIMCSCVSGSEKLIEVLEERFRKYPTCPDNLWGWGEPGRFERRLQLPRVEVGTFRTKEPIVQFNHLDGLSGSRVVLETDVVTSYLEPWGSASELWRSIHR